MKRASLISTMMIFLLSLLFSCSAEVDDGFSTLHVKNYTGKTGAVSIRLIHQPPTDDVSIIEQRMDHYILTERDLTYIVDFYVLGDEHCQADGANVTSIHEILASAEVMVDIAKNNIIQIIFYIEDGDLKLCMIEK